MFPCVHSIVRLNDVGLNPHWPTRLLIKGNARRHLVRRLVKPGRIPGHLPPGPVKQQDGFVSCACDVPSLASIQIATSTWYKLARKEWQSITGNVSRNALSIVPRFKWAPAVGPLALPDIGASSHSV